MRLNRSVRVRNTSTLTQQPLADFEAVSSKDISELKSTVEEFFSTSNYRMLEKWEYSIQWYGYTIKDRRDESMKQITVQYNLMTIYADYPFSDEELEFFDKLQFEVCNSHRYEQNIDDWFKAEE